MLGAGNRLLYVRTVSLTMACRELTGTPEDSERRVELSRSFSLVVLVMLIPEGNNSLSF